jgi:hypothetical protein
MLKHSQSVIHCNDMLQEQKCVAMLASHMHHCCLDITWLKWCERVLDDV